MLAVSSVAVIRYDNHPFTLQGSCRSAIFIGSENKKMIEVYQEYIDRFLCCDMMTHYIFRTN